MSTEHSAKSVRQQVFGWKDMALYALAIGAGESDLDYLLEPDPKVLPSWAVIPALDPVFDVMRESGLAAPQLVHSAQRVEQLAPLPSHGTVSTEGCLKGAWNVRIGTMVQIETTSSVGDQLCARTLWSLFIPGSKAGDTGRAPTLLRTRPPKDTAPAFAEEWATQPTQALLYRLTGDLNPIHARPDLAREAGFERPILHGLCTYGFATRVALKHLAGNEPRRFRSFEARFTRPVLPGQTLVVEGYPLEPGSAAVVVRIKETGEMAVGHGLFEYEEG